MVNTPFLIDHLTETAVGSEAPTDVILNPVKFFSVFFGSYPDGAETSCL